jgi:hypothetical protein
MLASSYINPQLAAVLSAQGLPLPQDGMQQAPQFDQQQPPDPLQAPAPPPQADNINDGISSVGRPLDSAKADAALKKLHRQNRGDALMALGAELLGSRTFGEGLSRGILAYSQSLRSNRPQVKAVGDGEYEEVVDPRTGQSYMRPTAIHADKIAERGKPVVSGKHLYQYGLKQDGSYDGTVKDLAPPELEAKTVTDSAGNQKIVFVDNTTGAVYDPKGEVGPPPPPDAKVAPSSSPAPAGGQAGFSKAIAFTLPHEGGPTTDVNGYQVNHGINAKYNPGVDVPHLTEAGATDIYKTKYWDKSGASDLSAAMQTPYFDTYVISPKRAKSFLAQADGDPNKFMDLREAWLSDYSKSHPRLAKGIANRNRDLRATIGTTAAPEAQADANQPYYPDQAQAAPDNPWGLQPHNFTGGPATHFATAAELKAHGFAPNTVAQIDPKGGFHVLQKGDTGGGPLDDQTEEFFAQAVGNGTPISQLISGMGKDAAAQRGQVMRRMAKDAGADGLSGSDYSIQIAHYAAAKKNVANLETQFGTIQGNESTARKNGQAFIDASRAVPHQTSSMLLNKPIQSYLRHTGDPKVAAMDIAARTFATEYAKVIQGSPNGGGTLTDSAANEAVNVLRGDYSMKQKMAAYNQARIDMDNRISSLHANLQDAYAHMKDRAPELTGARSAKGNRTIVRTGTAKNGRKVAQYSDGTYGYLSN